MSQSKLADDLKITGEVTSRGDVEVDGVIEGNIKARKIETSKEAKIRGTLRCDAVYVGGRFEGTIDADKVELSSTANVDGEITSASLSMDEEAYFSGTSKRSPSEEPNVDADGAKQETPGDGTADGN